MGSVINMGEVIYVAVRKSKRDQEFDQQFFCGKGRRSGKYADLPFSRRACAAGRRAGYWENYVGEVLCAGDYMQFRQNSVYARYAARRRSGNLCL